MKIIYRRQIKLIHQSADKCCPCTQKVYPCHLWNKLHVLKHLKSFLEKLMGGEQQSLVETVKVAEILDLDAEQLLKLRDSLTK